MKQAANKTAIYLFCITEGEAFSAEACPERSEWAGRHPLRPVYSLVCEDLVAVVSLVPLEEFGEQALPSHLQDACWLEKAVRAHETVIEKVMESRTVLPMKFCTVFRTKAGVRNLLESRQEEFRHALARLHDKEEWEVKMYSQPAPSAQAAETGASLSGKDFLLKRKAKDLQAWEAINEAHRQAQRSFEKLSGYAEEIQPKPVPSQDSTREPKLILDAVCLLAKPRFKAFCQQLEGLRNELSGKGFYFQLSGPWPPYHFCTRAQANVGLS